MNRIGKPDSTRKAETRISKKTVNYLTLAIFAPLLILVGVAGFLIPASLSLTSGAAPYNVFHIVFGAIGLLVLWSRKEWLVNCFNAGFGLIDLYQALASYLNLLPKEYFLWTRVDDITHVALGLVLATIGFYGMSSTRNARRPPTIVSRTSPS